MSITLSQINGAWYKECKYLEDEKFKRERKIISSPDKKQVTFQQFPVTIGRESARQLVLDSEMASRAHAIIHEIELEEQKKYILQDIGSKTGTVLFANNKNEITIANAKTNRVVELKAGDTIIFGGTTVRVDAITR